MKIRTIASVATLVGVFAGTPAMQAEDEAGSFISLPKNVESIKLYGDARFRYQFENAKSFGSTTDKERSRWRYRARFGSIVNFKDSNVSMGVRAETSKNNDSTNANFGGYFDKVGDELFLGLVYITYEGENLTVSAGKQKHPFKISSAWWDSDINPEGISESFSVGDWNFNFGQYIVDETKESSSSGEDDFLFVAQGVWKTGDVTLAPIVLGSAGGKADASETSGNFSGENSNGYFHDFLVVALPFEVKLNSGKLFGTVGLNLKGDDAAAEPTSPFYDGGNGTNENLFFNFGYQFGSAKKAGQWQAGVEYRYIEAAAYTPNLSDSDFGKNSTNQEGLVAKYKYMATDFLSYGVTAFLTDSIDDSDYWGDAISKGKTTMLQVDAAIKF